MQTRRWLPTSGDFQEGDFVERDFWVSTSAGDVETRRERVVLITQHSYTVGCGPELVLHEEQLFVLAGGGYGVAHKWLRLGDGWRHEFVKVEESAFLSGGKFWMLGSALAVATKRRWRQESLPAVDFLVKTR